MNKWLSFALIFSGYLHAQRLQKTEGIRDNRQQIIYAITNAEVHLNPQQKISKGTVLVQNQKILDVGTQISIPKNAVVIDAQGQHLYPSFIDLNSQYGLENTTSGSTRTSTPEYERNDGKGAFGWNRAIQPQQAAIAQYAKKTADAKKLRANGFGVVMSHHADGIARGTGALLALSENKTEQENTLRAHAGNFFSFEKGSSTQQYPSSQTGAIALLRQTFIDFEWYKKQPSAPTYLHLEAMRQHEKLPHFFASQDKLSSLRAIQLGREFSREFVILGTGDEYQALDATAKSKAVFVIPMKFPETPDLSDPLMARSISLRDLKHWELAPYNFKALSEKGLEVALTAQGCTDFWEALSKIGATGVSETKILAALTTTPAKILGLGNELGQIKKGQWANFVILEDSLLASKNKVLENWVLGDRHEMEPLKQFEVLGKFVLKTKNQTDTLTLEPDNKYTLVVSDGTTIKGKYQLKNNNLQLAYNHQNQTNALFAMVVGAHALDAVRIQKGAALELAKLQLVEKKDAEPSKKKTEETPLAYQDFLYYPFQAYGAKQKPQAQNFAVTNATVWTLEGAGICENCDVLVQNGKIAAVGKGLKIPTGTSTIDGTGKHLTPGLLDEHSHIALSRGVNESGSSISAEVRMGDVINPEDINIYRQLAGGTTTSQLLHGSANTIGGQSAIIKLRWGFDAEEMKIKDAPGFIKFALGENVKQSNWGERMTVRYPQSRMGVEQFLFEQFYRAKTYQTAKGNQKNNHRTDLELEALVEILEGRRHITCHSYVQSEINMLMKVADSMGFRVNTFTHILEGYKVADKMKRHRAYASTFSDWWSYKMEVNEAIPFNAALLKKAGVLTAINSDDAEMGRRLNQEAAKTIKYGGVEEVEALKMVTLNPAQMLHLDDKIGSIKPGKDADLVLWNNHPLSNYARVEKTFVDGMLLFDAAEHIAQVAHMQAERQRLMEKALQKIAGGAKPAKLETEVDFEYHCETLESLHYHEQE